MRSLITSILTVAMFAANSVGLGQDFLEDPPPADTIRVQWPTEAVQQAAYVEPARRTPASPGTTEYVPLRPRSDSDKATNPGASGGLATMLGSLAIVLGLFFVIAWLLRRGMPAGASAIPNEVVQILGRTTLEGRQQVRLIRFGSKLLLTCVSQGGGMQTLAEITDPREIERLTFRCSTAGPSKFHNHLDRSQSAHRSRAIQLSEADDG